MDNNRDYNSRAAYVAKNGFLWTLGDSIFNPQRRGNLNDALIVVGGMTGGGDAVLKEGNPAAENAAKSPLLQRYLSESGGRWGNTATRQLNDAEATKLENQGYLVTGGAGRGPEEWFAGPGGGTKGGTFVDITATDGVRTVRIQTVSTLDDGVTLTASEAAAAARIRARFPGDQLILVSKQTGAVIP